jgi:PD-(D/E)XK nuclease superfamily
MTDATIVRASSLSGWPDCPRRGAARMFRREIEAAGFTLRHLPNGIGAAVGSAVHAAGKFSLDERLEKGTLPPVSAVMDCAVESVKEIIAEGITYDARVTLNASDAHQQVARMAATYRNHVAPDIQPILIETRLEAEFSENIILSGQADVIAREPGRIRDLKTGTRLGSHAAQLGAYSLLARTPTLERPEGIDIKQAGIDFVQRVSMKKPQPNPVAQMRDVGAAETAASRILQDIETSLHTFRHGDERRRFLPGDPWAFSANSSSMLCGERYCSAWGTDFCHEHAPKGDE